MQRIRESAAWGMQQLQPGGALKALPMAALSLKPASAVRPSRHSAQFTAGT
jgi:hypothetical protein